MPYKDPEKEKEYRQRYWQKNKERLTQLHDAWQRGHREYTRKAGQKSYYKHHKERRKTMDAWKAKHPNYGKEYYQRNKEKQQARAIELHDQHLNDWRQWEKEFYGWKCVRCNQEFHPICLDWHHIIPENKKFNVAQMMRRPFTRHNQEVLRQELRKCKHLCRNCHALVHEELRQEQKQREE